MTDNRELALCTWTGEYGKECMHTVLDVENFNPFSKIYFWTLFTHNCIALSTLCNNLPRTHKAKSSTNKEQSVPCKTALTIERSRCTQEREHCVQEVKGPGVIRKGKAVYKRWKLQVLHRKGKTVLYTIQYNTIQYNTALLSLWWNSFGSKYKHDKHKDITAMCIII